MAFEVSVSSDQVFASERGVELVWDVYRPVGVPQGSDAPTSQGSLPAVLLFHGGGWRL